MNEQPTEQSLTEQLHELTGLKWIGPHGGRYSGHIKRRHVAVLWHDHGRWVVSVRSPKNAIGELFYGGTLLDVVRAAGLLSTPDLSSDWSGK